jgi:DNA-binding NarL/FixJ family response regulator
VRASCSTPWRRVVDLPGAQPCQELALLREVLVLMAEGRSNHAIAAELVITDRAVEKHVTSIFGRLNLSSTVDDHRRVLAVRAFLNA